jgi:hypothetical protein
VIDTQTPNSPGWWFKRLFDRLVDRQGHFDKLDSYYRGTNGIPVHANKQVSESYRRLMSVSGANFARLIVEATRERMTPLGFRTGSVSDELGDEVAWRIWQANSLDADHMLIDRATLSMGAAYAIVGGVDPEIGVPLITPEDPREVICEVDPARRRKVRAALKVFTDDVMGLERAYVYLPGFVVRASRPITTDTGPASVMNMDAWNWDGPPEALPAPVVPVVPFYNLTGINGTPEGEFEGHLATLDRINYTILTRVEAMTMQAFRQRGIKGLPLTDADGDEIDYEGDFLAGPGELWHLPDTADIWESGLIDLTPILSSEKQDITTLAGATSTPMSYLFPDDSGGSAEGAQLKRESVTFKARDRMRQQGESYEQMMSLALLFAGESERATRSDMEIIWASPERYTLAERASAAAQLKDVVPNSTIAREVLQFTPQEIARMRAEQLADVLMVPPAPSDAPG